MTNTPEDIEAAATPRWVKAFALIALVVLVLVVVLLVTGRGGKHGPGRHVDGDGDAPGHKGPPPGMTHQ